MDKKKITQLCASFFKIGAIAFGGGYAVAPLLQKEIVEYRKWITSEELTNIMAISQALPGIIFTNSATMIGYKVAGFFGSLIATTAAITPTFIITLLFASYFWDFTGNFWVQKIFAGVLLGVTSLIIYSITKMWKTAVKNYFDILSVLLSSVLLIIFKTSAIYVILGIAVLGFTYNITVLKWGKNK